MISHNYSYNNEINWWMPVSREFVCFDNI